ncbi:MAG TPA: HAD hydrolase family protein [Blastocatellia bacterium]|nr:HAD hydrolase family protein [Blastocatellia bacterium]
MGELTNDIRDRLFKIKLLIVDCDGVLTDGRIVLLSETEETKFFDVKDGHAIRMAGRAGLKTAIISGRASFAVRARARDLGIAYLYEGAWIKIGPYEEVLAAEGIGDEAVCYVGDDVTDIPLMRRAGLAVAVADAVEEARQHAHYVTERPGGRGAVREVIELIMKAQSKWDDAMSRYLA